METKVKITFDIVYEHEKEIPDEEIKSSVRQSIRCPNKNWGMHRDYGMSRIKDAVISVET